MLWGYYHLVDPRNLFPDLLLYDLDQVNPCIMSPITIAGRPYSDHAILYVDKLDVAAEGGILGLYLLDYSLDFLDVLFYSVHYGPFRHTYFIRRGGLLDILDLIITRRSIRKYTGRPISDELIDKVIEAGRWAPSGLNNQPWKFAVIRDPSLRDILSELTHYSRIVRDADLLIAVFLDTEKSYHRIKDIQAVGACTQNMLLAAYGLGLGAVWLGEILKSADEIRTILGLPAGLELMAVIATGHPAEKPRPTHRKDLSELIVFRR